MRNLIPIFCLLLFGCDLSDFKFPEVPKHQDSTEGIQSENNKKADTPRIPAPKYSTNQSTTNQQDPQKNSNPSTTSLREGNRFIPTPLVKTNKQDVAVDRIRDQWDTGSPSV